jgi:hypothetical protein
VYGAHSVLMLRWKLKCSSSARNAVPFKVCKSHDQKGLFNLNARSLDIRGNSHRIWRRMVIGFMRIRVQDIIPHRVNSLADNHDSLAWYFPLAVTAVSIDMSLVLGIITETRPKSGGP